MLPSDLLICLDMFLQFLLIWINYNMFLKLYIRISGKVLSPSIIMSQIVNLNTNMSEIDFFICDQVDSDWAIVFSNKIKNCFTLGNGLEWGKQIVALTKVNMTTIVSCLNVLNDFIRENILFFNFDFLLSYINQFRRLWKRTEQYQPIRI